MSVRAAVQAHKPAEADAAVIPFPATMSPARRIDVALSRIRAEGRQLARDAASLSASASQLRALADSMDQSVARLDGVQAKLAAEQARSRAIAAEADRIERMIAGGQLRQALSSYQRLARAVGKPGQ